VLDRYTKASTVIGIYVPDPEWLGSLMPPVGWGKLQLETDPGKLGRLRRLHRSADLAGISGFPMPVRCRLMLLNACFLPFFFSSRRITSSTKAERLWLGKSSRSKLAVSVRIQNHTASFQDLGLPALFRCSLGAIWLYCSSI
jgi:hypothetical protein